MIMSVRALVLSVMLAAGFACPASAATEPKTRLISCATGSCLLVTGRRADRGSTVVINDHAVLVQGSRKWRARLPLETLREWSAPYARTITVSVIVAGTQARTSAEVDLPIGLLGHADLALLVVSAR